MPKKKDKKRLKKQIKKKGFQRNFYLEKLGIDVQEYGTNFCDNSDKRWKKWMKQKKKYGFDERETWCIDHVFVEWIYSHFKMYKDIAPIDLKFHNIYYFPDGPDGGSVLISQGKAIKIILKACKKYLRTYSDNTVLPAPIYGLIGQIMPYMWW